MCVCILMHADLIKKMLLPNIGKMGREYATLLLHNVIDSQCRAFSETAGESGAVNPGAVQLCLEEGNDSWIEYLIKARGAQTALPKWATTQEDYDYERRKRAVDVLGKVLLFISTQEAAVKNTARAGGGTYSQPGVHSKVFNVLKEVLGEEHRVFLKHRDEKKSLDVEVLVRLLEALPYFFNCASSSQVYLCASVCVRMCLLICVPACLSACLHVRACVHACVRACVRACVCACVRACIHACICLHVYMYLYMHICMHRFSYISIHMNMHSYIKTYK